MDCTDLRIVSRTASSVMDDEDLMNYDRKPIIPIKDNLMRASYHFHESSTRFEGILMPLRVVRGQLLAIDMTVLR